MKNQSESRGIIEKSDIFDILQNDRRRYILEILRKQGNKSVHYLSEEIARMEAKTEEINSSTIKSIYISLLQVHLPKMESFNVITYDKENNMVKLLPPASNLNTYIETVKNGDISWSQFFSGFSTFALVGSIAIYTGLLKWVTSSQWLLFILAFFFISSIAYHRHVTKL
jgi:hypothetical protein